jgi:hypothetical protein
MISISKSIAARATLAFCIAWVCGCSDNKKAESTNSVQPANVSMTIKRGESDGMPTLVATRIVTAQVRIDAIDYETRGIVLTGPDGNQDIYTVGPEVVNFNQLHKGDLVNARFTEKMAISVQKSSEQPEAVSVSAIALPQAGEKPGMVAARTAKIVATVTAINHEARTVSITGPQGNTLTFNVSKEAKGFENVQVGDAVIVQYEEAVEISVVNS